MIGRILVPVLLLVGGLYGAEDYTGPKPPKADTLYLQHADNLIPTEAVEAHQETKKDDLTYSVAGAASAARTPLAEPIFLFKSEKMTPESLELYRFDVKNGRRELTVSQKRRRGDPRPLRLQVTKLDRGLYRVEASEMLENGEYGISPSGSNLVFCFSVY